MVGATRDRNGRLMTGRDRAERMLAVATRGLTPGRRAWGRAMRAELAAIDDPAHRLSFARSAAGAALVHGHGTRIVGAVAAGTIVTLIAIVTARVQFESAQPGLLAVTVPVPAAVVLLVALSAAAVSGSLRLGLETGALAFVASFVAVASVAAIEGLTWMSVHGVFILDGDPPRGPVEARDVILDLFTTGLWIGHVVFWLPALLIGALIGRRLSDVMR